MSLHAVQNALSPPSRTLAIQYILIASAANLVWEVVQLPLYTIWRAATGGDLVYAVIHCTAGDVIILVATLLLALLLVGNSTWPRRGYARVALATTLLGVSYTVLSEWLNADISRNWTYTPAMPMLPPLETGLTPFLQWLIIPPVVMGLIGRTALRSDIMQ
jgi:hypothetical protein